MTKGLHCGKYFASSAALARTRVCWDASTQVWAKFSTRWLGRYGLSLLRT